MKKIEKGKVKQERLEDTLEFLSLDDETIKSYGKKSRTDSKQYDDAEYEDENYEDEDYESEEDEDYEDEDYESEEDEDYEDEDYESEEDEDYEDEDYESGEDEDYEDEDYESEEDEDEEGEEYRDQDDEYRGNAVGRFVHLIKHLTPLDYVVAVFGCFILIAAVVVGNVYLSARATDKQVAAFAEVGTEIEGISVIGESGLIAVSDAESARLSQMMEPEGEPEEQTGQEVEEKTNTDVIEVGIHITSIKSDIKIKFVNKKTNKLIGSVPFEIEVAGDSKTYNLKDEDKDGIIYQTGIAAGTYTVKAVALQGDVYSKYSLTSEGQTVKVVDTIEYKKVDVEDEIKTEAEVNVAVEDTAQQNTEIESVLTDTVEWAESTKAELNPDDNYQEISISDIPDPSTIARAAGFMKFSQNDTVSGNSEVIVEQSVTITEAPGSITKGSTGSIKGTTSPEGGTIEWSSSNTNVVTVDGSGTLTGIAAGTATITGTYDGKSAAVDVTVIEPVTEAYSELKIEGDSAIHEGKTGKVTGTTTPAGGTVTWSSNNTNVVTVDDDGNLKGVAIGEATITGTCGDNVTATWIVKVVKDASGDTISKLKDKNGAQVYIKNSEGKYVEAVYADYYTDAKFYLKKADVVYTYTGWQTIDGFTYFFDKDGNYATGEQIIQGAKYSFDSSGRLSSGSGVLGIDVSKWNGTIDWNAVRNSGISYVIIRCGYRGSTTGALIEDPKFHANIQGAQNAGIKVGVYFFTQAVNDVEAVEEASMVLSLIKGYNLDFPVFLDVEATSGNSGRADKISVDARTAVCSAFCQTIQNSGYKAGIYANTEWLSGFINTPGLTNYKIWLAQYAAAPTYARTRIDMWQYSSKGTVSGINGNVDMNISYMSY